MEEELATTWAGLGLSSDAGSIQAMTVSYALEGNVSVITLDDGKANVFSHAALEELTAALDRREPESHAVLLVGREGRFSAGFDLATMTASPESMRSLVKAGAVFTARVLMDPRPVVAACTGHALAAGALLLLACDRRLGAVGGWKIGLNEVSIGMALPVWAVELARYRLAPTAFDWNVVLGQVCDPVSAVASGFLDRVVEPGELLAEATKVAESLAGLRSSAVGGTKQRAREELVTRMLADIDGDLERISPPTP